MEIAGKRVLVIGQLRTSRTETVEAYVAPRAAACTVIGFMSPFAHHNEARCTVYRHGTREREFRLPCLAFGTAASRFRPLVALSFLSMLVAVAWALLRTRTRHDLCIGIATFSATIATLLRSAGIVRAALYYCLDFYPRPAGGVSLCLEHAAYRVLERRLMRSADMVWDLCGRIPEARETILGIPRRSYRTVSAPLGYADDVGMDVPLDQRERWTMGFVGTLSPNQGVQMVIEALPDIAKLLPDIRLRIIGHGPFAEELRALVQKTGVTEKVVLHGFVREEEEVHRILAHCVVGLATWTGDSTDNSRFADPGKPKLYALLGLPIIISDAPEVSQTIADLAAGIRIPYDRAAFVAAVREVIGTDEALNRYLAGVRRFQPLCRASTIFDRAFADTPNP